MSDRFVAHFDILGWKYAVKNNFEGAWRVFDHFADAHDGLNSGMIEVNGIVRPRRLQSRLFSDTIIISTPSAEDVDLYELLVRCGELVKNSISGFLPVRGGIALGSFRENPARNLFAGPALNRAYEIGEEAQWFGVVLDDDVAARAATLRPTFESDARDPGIVPWDVPLKHGGSVRRSVLNWPPIYRFNFIKWVAIAGEGLMEFVHPLFGPWSALPADVRAKYDNTIAFIVSQLRAHHGRNPMET